MKKIAVITINLEARTIAAEDTNGTNIVWALTADGGPVIKWVKASAAGFIIQALVRMLEDKGPS